jgi:hypothetical protein
MGKISWISLQFAGPNWWKLPFLPWIGLKIRSKWTFQKTGPEKLPLDIGNRGCDGLKPGELTVQFCLWHQTLNFRILWIWRCIFASGINHSISSSFLRASCHLAPNLQVSGVGGGRLRAFLTAGHELAHSGGFSGYELAHSWAFPTVWILTSGYELAHSWFLWIWACSFLVSLDMSLLIPGFLLCSSCELACWALFTSWEKHGYNGSSFWSLPRSFFVVIETLWVLCNCLMTHSFCVWAGGLCFSTFSLTVLKWSLLVSSGKFLLPSSVVPGIWAALAVRCEQLHLCCWAIWHHGPMGLHVSQ